MIQALERAFPYLLFAPALSVLVYFDGLLFPFLTPKTLLIRGAFVLAIAAFVALVLSGRSFYFGRLKSPLSWIPGALLVWGYISSLMGVDFYHSFWSIFDRGDGLLTLSAVVGFFYLVLIYADDAFVRRLFVMIAWVASFAALFGVLQWVQWVSGINIPLLPDGADRVSSTFGNPTFFSSFIAVSLFVTLFLARSLTGRWRKWAHIGIVLQGLGILAAATRGTLLAMIVAGLVVLAYHAWRGSGQYRIYARAGMLGLLITVGLFVTFRGELASVPFAPISRLASISTSDATVESRLFIWQNVVPEALKSPIVGVGAEHIQVLFNRFYDPTEIIEEWFDRTHNAFLDYLVQYGVPGFLLYVVLIGAFLREAWRFLSSDAESASFGGFFLLAAVVYAVQNFFVFDTAVSLWLFLALFASMLVWRPARPGPAHQPAQQSLGVDGSVVAPSPLPIRIVPQWFLLGAVALVSLLIVPISLMPLRANLLLAEGYLYQVYDVRRSVGAIEKGLKLTTYADMEYGYQLYEWYTERQITMLSGEAQVLAYRTARDILHANYEKYPYDARTAIYYAHVLDVAPKGEEASESHMRDVLDRAVELSPKRIQPRYLLANISIRKGDALSPGSSGKREHYLEAIQQLSEYSALVPRLSEPYYIIATLYLTLGNSEEAKKWADKGLTVYKPDTSTARRASRYYVTVEDWENAQHFLTDLSAGEPENYPVLYDLAKAEFLAGNPARARQIVETLKERAPGLVEADPNFLEALSE